MATRLLSQLAVGSEECGPPGRRGGTAVSGWVGRVHVELITYLQLLVGHGGQSCHVEVVEAGTHVHLGILRSVGAPHGQALRSRRGEREQLLKARVDGTD